MWQLANARDDRRVEPEHERKSMGSEETLGQDVTGRAEVKRLLLSHCERVARHLRGKGMRARGVRVKGRYQQGLELVSRDHRLNSLFDDSETLYREACRLLDRLDLDRPMRLIGVAAFDLTEETGGQGDLFDDGPTPRSRVEHAMDSLRERLGDKVRRASLKPRDPP